MNIILADDHPLFREGLKTILETEPSYSVIKQVDSAAELHSGKLANCSVVDQRGELRNVGDGSHDIGAFEFILSDVESGFVVIPLPNGKVVVIPN